MGELAQQSVVVFDDQPLWLSPVKQLLERIGLVVVGCTTSAVEAVELIEQQRPSLLLVGLESSRGELAGLACVKRAREVHPELRVVVLPPRNDPQLVEAAFAAGASVCCAKTASSEDLASAIRQLFERSVYVAPAHVQATRMATLALSKSRPELTPRELEILCLAAEGRSNSQVAKMLWITEQTVKFHLSNVYKKLNVANRTEASRWAQLHGLLPVRERRSATDVS